MPVTISNTLAAHPTPAAPAAIQPNAQKIGNDKMELWNCRTRSKPNAPTD
jgi:hypothetical protein